MNNVSAQYAVKDCDKATLNGYVDPNGNPTIAWFEWGPISSLGHATPPQTYYSYTSFSYQITGLTENSTYYYQAKFRNSVQGEWSSSTISFTTPACPVSIYTVTASAGTGGTITPSSRTVTSGTTATFTVTPNSGYTIGSVTGCNGYLSGNIYTTGSIISNCSVYANFNANPPTTCQDPSATNYGGTLPQICAYYLPRPKCHKLWRSIALHIRADNLPRPKRHKLWRKVALYISTNNRKYLRR